ncbi:hypothetical protein N665_0056s0031 [Sinapis alba]|nr:hypothetical protein N665_0056s0031 [Sinapis alba]
MTLKRKESERYEIIALRVGVSKWDLFLWFLVKGVCVDIPCSGVIYFNVEVVHKRYSILCLRLREIVSLLERDQSVGRNIV